MQMRKQERSSRSFFVLEILTLLGFLLNIAPGVSLVIGFFPWYQVSKNSSGTFVRRAMSCIFPLTSNPELHFTLHDSQSAQGTDGSPDASRVFLACSRFLYPYAYI